MQGTLWLLTQGETRKTKRVRLGYIHPAKWGLYNGD